MSKKDSKKQGYGKLIGTWDPPEKAGDPIGCVATTFTFSTVFFEEECLGRFLQMQSDAAQDGPVYIIEREEKLNSVRAATVLVDAHHCKGNRSLRWDLLAVRAPKAILHAKITLLQWTHLIRLIVTSANLTEDGYRRNQELYGILDFSPGGDAPLDCLDQAISYLRETATYSGDTPERTSPAVQRLSNFLDGVDEVSRDWGNPDSPRGRRGIRVHAILTGPGRASVYQQVANVWPEGSPPWEAFVTSPFFDPPGSTNRPASELWQNLKQRGEARVTFNVTAEEVAGENAILLHAPKELIDAQPKGRNSVSTEIKIIPEQLEDEVAIHRPLHMKSIWFSGADWVGYLIGSSNFTSAGLGLSTNPNLEANFLYLVSSSANKRVNKMLSLGRPEGFEIDPDLQMMWKPMSEDEEDTPGKQSISLPAAFGQAIYRTKGENAFIQLTFNASPPKGWYLRLDADIKKVLLDEASWFSLSDKNHVILPWLEPYAPAGFEVTWDNCEGFAWWPVNIDKASSLPPPEELRELPLDILINILTTARPLHQVLRAWLKQKNSLGNQWKPLDPYDPHKRVDTSGFLLQKTRRVSWALTALREKLERPVASQNSLEWRLKGPVGVRAVAKAISREAKSDEERAFLLTELALDIARVKPKQTPGHLPPEDVKREIDRVIRGLHDEVKELTYKAPVALEEYIKSAFVEVLQ